MEIIIDKNRLLANTIYHNIVTSGHPMFSFWTPKKITKTRVQHMYDSCISENTIDIFNKQLLPYLWLCGQEPNRNTTCY